MKLTIIFVCLSCSLNAQSIDFINLYFNNKMVGGVNMELDDEGNIYVIGTFEGTVDLDPGVAEELFTANPRSFFISKYNPTGEVEWIKVIGEDCNARDIEIDKNGDLYVVGQFKGEINFDPETTDFILDSGANSTFGYVFKLDSNGNPISLNRYQCSYGVAEPTIIQTDEENNVIIAGTYSEELNVKFEPFTFSLLQSPIGSDAFICKYDANLTLKWKESLGWTSGGTWIEDVYIDEEGDVYALGHFTGVIDFDEDEQIESNGGHDIFLAKHPKSGGIWNWYKTYGGEGHDVANTLMFNEADNNLWIGGHFDQDIPFEINGNIVNHSTTQQKGLLITANTFNGGIEEIIPFEGAKGQILTLRKDNADNIWMYGAFSGSLVLGNTALQTDNFSALFIGEMDEEGTSLSGIKIAESINFPTGNPSNKFRKYHSFLLNDSGDFFLSGDFENSSLLTLENTDETIIVEDNCANGFVLKISESITANTVDEANFREQKSVVYPNPSSNGTLSLKGEDKLKEISIYDSKGYLVFHKENPGKSLDLNHLNSGIYFIQLIFLDRKEYKKWIKN